jgi:DnaJ-class molecular chaperone
MFRTKYLNILGLEKNASDDDIKKAYHTIALKNHPDKTQNLDKDEKEKCEKKFKDASDAYHKLLNNNIMDELNDLNMNDFNMNDFNMNDFDMNDFGFDFGFENNDSFKNYFNMFSGVASNLFKNYNNVRSLLKTNITISYYDIIHKRKFDENVNVYGLKVNVNIDCSKFPEQIIEKEINGIKFNILINFKLESDNNYDHIIKKNGKVDLIYNIGINHYQFYKGFKYEFGHIDGENVKIKVDKMNDNDIIKKNRGLNGGKLIIKINIINPKKDNISNISKEDYNVLISLLNKLNNKVYKDK